MTVPATITTASAASARDPTTVVVRSAGYSVMRSAPAPAAAAAPSAPDGTEADEPPEAGRRRGLRRAGLDAAQHCDRQRDPETGNEEAREHVGGVMPRERERGEGERDRAAEADERDAGAPGGR